MTGSSARAAALAALRRAEERTGARPVEVSSLATPVGAVAPGGSRAGAPGVVRTEAAGGTSTPRGTAVERAAGVQAEAPSRPALLGTRTGQRPPLPVPAQLAELLPGGLQRGSVTQVTGSAALVLALLAEAGRTDEVWAAVVGQPVIGMLAAAEMGVDLTRLILVPHPGPETATALAALFDGVDVVVVGPEAPLLGQDRRRLVARARDRGTVVLATAPWPGAQTVLEVTGVRWRGLACGSGRLRSRELAVRRTGRAGSARPVQVQVELPFGDRELLPGESAAASAVGAPAADVRVPGAPAAGVIAAPAAGVLADPVGPVPAVQAVPSVPVNNAAQPDLRLVGRAS